VISENRGNGNFKVVLFCSKLHSVSDKSRNIASACSNTATKIQGWSVYCAAKLYDIKRLTVTNLLNVDTNDDWKFYQVTIVLVCCNESKKYNLCLIITSNTEKLSLLRQNDYNNIEDLHVTSSMMLPMVAAMLEVFSSRRAGRFNGNNVRKRPKIGHFPGPIETFQCIKSNWNIKIWKVFIYLHLDFLGN
jgi:hypothetical protein